MRKILGLLLLLLFPSLLYSQCTVTATPTQDINCGECVNLNSSGSPVDNSVSHSFSSGLPSGWTAGASLMTTDPCGSGASGYLWMGNATAAPRTVSTNAYDTSCGGEICFDFRMAPPGAPAPCEDPDLPFEGMFIQYSNDGGWTWTSIDYFDPTTFGAFSYQLWTTYCYPIPIAAQTPSTMFRWHQEMSSGMCCDHWGIDNFSLSMTDCDYYYDWSHIPGYPDVANGGIVCPTESTTYTVTYTNGINSCSTDVDVNVSFSDVNLVASPSLLDSCGECSELSANIIDPYVTTYSWNWTGSGLLPINDSTQIVCPTNDNWYFVELSAGGCSVMDSAFVDMNIPVPNDALIFSPDSCSPLPMIIENTVLGSDCKIIVSSDNFYKIYNGCGNIVDTYSQAGLYDVTLIMTSQEGCIMDTTITNAFHVWPVPIVGFDWYPNEGTIINNLIQFNNTTIGGVFYEWDLGDGTNSTDINVNHEYNEIGVYQVELISNNQFSCSDTAWGQIFIKDDFYMYVPNAFTPDGNSFNNEFKPVLENHDPYRYHLIIYNRWGEIMFESHNSDYGWNGSYGDQIAPDGVYIWEIQASTKTGMPQSFKGHVTLLR